MTALVEKLNAAKIPSNVDVVVAPTYLHIDLVQRSLTNPSVQVAAQDCVEYKNGAYTGEVSAEMIKDFGVNWVILGHSERRHIFKTDDQVRLQHCMRSRSRCINQRAHGGAAQSADFSRRLMLLCLDCSCCILRLFSGFVLRGRLFFVPFHRPSLSRFASLWTAI